MQRWRHTLPGVGTLREVAVIVLGILIAFALDAWWEQRTAAARERAHVHALASDFQENVKRLLQIIEVEERISESSRQLLILARGDTPAPLDTVRRHVGMVFTSTRFEPVMGAYEALVNSAGLTLLRDDALRASLAEFAARLDVRYYEHFSNEMYLSFIREFTGELSFFAHSVAGEWEGVPPDHFRRLLANPKFQEYLALRHLSERDVAREYRALSEQAEAILARLRTLSQ